MSIINTYFSLVENDVGLTNMKSIVLVSWTFSKVANPSAVMMYIDQSFSTEKEGRDAANPSVYEKFVGDEEEELWN